MTQQRSNTRCEHRTRILAIRRPTRCALGPRTDRNQLEMLRVEQTDMRGPFGRKRDWLLCLVSFGVLATTGCGSNQKASIHGQDRRRPAARTIRLAALRGRIVFSRRDDIWIANADGSGLRRLTSGRGPEFDPSFSPDGTRIVYRDSRRGINANDEIYVMNADGSHQR